MINYYLVVIRLELDHFRGLLQHVKSINNKNNIISHTIQNLEPHKFINSEGVSGSNKIIS